MCANALRTNTHIRIHWHINTEHTCTCMYHPINSPFIRNELIFERTNILYGECSAKRVFISYKFNLSYLEEYEFCALSMCVCVYELIYTPRQEYRKSTSARVGSFIAIVLMYCYTSRESNNIFSDYIVNAFFWREKPNWTIIGVRCDGLLLNYIPDC